MARQIFHRVRALMSTTVLAGASAAECECLNALTRLVADFDTAWAKGARWIEEGVDNRQRGRDDMGRGQVEQEARWLR
ncbi:hypothetical protein [Nocardia callitridis]|uniref:hypothetical protein n=1 Tax=Nocardia callitridis TaxID=648753 RepID=UPI0031EBA06A